MNSFIGIAWRLLMEIFVIIIAFVRGPTMSTVVKGKMADFVLWTEQTQNCGISNV